MINYKPKHEDMEMWLICVAIGDNPDLIQHMNKNEDGSYPVMFSVGGVELDFCKVAKRVDESISEMVSGEANKLLQEKYGDCIGELMEIQERIEEQKKTLFKYEWE